MYWISYPKIDSISRIPKNFLVYWHIRKWLHLGRYVVFHFWDIRTVYLNYRIKNKLLFWKCNFMTLPGYTKLFIKQASSVKLFVFRLFSSKIYRWGLIYRHLVYNRILLKLLVSLSIQTISLLRNFNFLGKTSKSFNWENVKAVIKYSLDFCQYCKINLESVIQIIKTPLW